MKKKKRSKLQLNRETLRNLETDKLGGAAGAAFCTSERCTNNCTANNCTVGASECFCPQTDNTTDLETNDCNFPTVLGCTLTCTAGPDCP